MSSNTFELSQVKRMHADATASTRCDVCDCAMLGRPLAAPAALSSASVDRGPSSRVEGRAHATST
jgi:hypothetical protein